MDYSIYIRPLLISDAEKSFLWRNDPDLWRHTREEWSKCTELESEVSWIKYTLEKTTDKCFAICLNSPDQHIGNVELTNIADQKARCSVLIGEKVLWGKGIAKRAINLVSDYAFSYQKLKALFIEVYKENYASLSAYKKCGFVEDGLLENGFVLLILNSEKYFANKSKAHE
ncbi:GNAT family N-acetyltransferase [Pedobacter nutrimenti]|uniref:RimJ/RimL family protein N-acetyltransferase n=1 Tax=Pedobacter nutrimenti TaxID=1241337 RepID=A0A318UE53_9SPHI|nr:GNAT family protein [Pedobacter nutrimenti]PYF74674.1 RimJ/RimL family protein N-acetyltransferase [Pedobacter nutrimenti]